MKINTLATLITLALSAGSLSAYAETTLVADDNLNVIHGMNDTMRYRFEDSAHWIDFVSEKNFEDFRGDVTIVVAEKEPATTTTTIPSDSTISVEYSEGMTALAGWSTVYNDQTYIATRTTNSVPGTDDSWVLAEGSEPDTDTSGLTGKELGRFHFHHWIGEEATQFQNQQAIEIADQKKVIGTFSERGIDEAITTGTSYFSPEKLSAKWSDKLTHLIYSDAILSNGNIIADDFVNAKALIARLNANEGLKNVKKLITINGSGEQLFYTAAKNHYAQKFEDILTDADSADTLAYKMVNYMLANKFDGINIQWTETDTDTDRQNFVNLIKDVRKYLTKEGKKSDKYYQLTATVTGDHRNMQFVDPLVTAPLLDAINVATYSFNAPTQNTLTAHKASLYANSQDVDAKLNVAAALREYQEVYQVPKNKLIMGVDFAGYGWESVDATETIQGLPGLFSNGSATMIGDWDDTNTDIKNGYTPYNKIKNIVNAGGFTTYTDIESKGKYSYNPTSKIFYSYEDSSSLNLKANYIMSEGLGGVMIANLSGDTTDTELGNIIAKVKDTSAVINDVQLLSIEMIGTFPQIRVEIEKDFKGTYAVSKNGVLIASLYNNKASTRFSIETQGHIVIAQTGDRSLKEGDVITITKDDGNKITEVNKLTVNNDMLLVNYDDKADESLNSISIRDHEIYVNLNSNFGTHYVLFRNDSYYGEIYSNGYVASGGKATYSRDVKHGNNTDFIYPVIPNDGSVFTLFKDNVNTKKSELVSTFQVPAEPLVDENFISTAVVKEKGNYVLEVRFNKNAHAQYTISLADKYVGELHANNTSQYFTRSDTANEIVMKRIMKDAQRPHVGEKIIVERKLDSSHKGGDRDYVANVTVTQSMMN